MKRKAYVMRRVIGDVNIFDIVGSVVDDVIGPINNYINSYIKECQINNIIINAKEVQSIEPQEAYFIVNLISKSRKPALFVASNGSEQKFLEHKKSRNLSICHSEEDIISLFGKELVEHEKIIPVVDRRKSKRMKTAYNADIDLIDEKGEVIRSQALITNMSEGGLFAEYFDLKTSFEVSNFNYIRQMKTFIKIQPPSDNKEKDEDIWNYRGEILRIEFVGNQTGIAIKFLS